MKDNKVLAACLFGLSVLLFNSVNYLILLSFIVVLAVFFVIMPLALLSVIGPKKWQTALSRIVVLFGFLYSAWVYSIYIDKPTAPNLLGSQIGWMVGVLIAKNLAHICHMEENRDFIPT